MGVSPAWRGCAYWARHVTTTVLGVEDQICLPDPTEWHRDLSGINTTNVGPANVNVKIARVVRAAKPVATLCREPAVTAAFNFVSERPCTFNFNMVFSMDYLVCSNVILHCVTPKVLSTV